MTSFRLTQQQKLQTKLAPVQLQMNRLLEIPSVDIEQRINEELQENPVLEEGVDPEDNGRELQEDDEYGDLGGDDFLEDSYLEQEQNRRDYDAGDDDYEPILYGNSGGYEENVSSREVPYGGDSLIDYLKSQVYLTKMTKPQRHIAKWVLGNIDDDGYLRRTIEQLVDDLSFQEGLIVPDEEMADIVAQIKQFDPPGIASANLQECLVTQLSQKEQTDAVKLAIRILTRKYDAFTKRNYSRIIQQLDITEEQFRDAVVEITRLNQSPTNAFVADAMESKRSSIVPDAEVTQVDDKLRVSLLFATPDLRLNPEYVSMVDDMSQSKEQRKTNKSAITFIRTKMREASIFIEALRQRNETLLATVRAIAEMQKDFFMEGDETLIRPLVLQEVADRINMDVSTISRACNNKYVQTDFGIYPMKFFFSESLKNTEGEDVSTRAIKSLLRELVDEEDKTNPLSDDQMVDMLREHGYNLARRTVAKYRDMLGIPVARLRREI
ncbi:MAG: RNA polymerase factor sigma-54 [Paludibacteraceae bacterium]|nr:RNA polymerase factor sigma-54 [Paludibacteraceae bacterium]